MTTHIPVKTHERTLKKEDSNSSPIDIVKRVKTPIGNINPHHPILKGNPPEVLIITTATTNQTMEKPQRIKPTRNPMA